MDGGGGVSFSFVCFFFRSGKVMSYWVLGRHEGIEHSMYRLHRGLGICEKNTHPLFFLNRMGGQCSIVILRESSYKQNTYAFFSNIKLKYMGVENS